MTIKVEFEGPDGHWLGMTITSDNHAASIWSDWYGGALHGLVDAVDLLKVSSLERTVEWHGYTSPWDQMHQVRFMPEQAGIRLKFLQFSGHSDTLRDRGITLLEAVGSYTEICIPFWRALRRLQTSFTPEKIASVQDEFVREGMTSFPHRELDQLTILLKEGRSSPKRDTTR